MTFSSSPAPAPAPGHSPSPSPAPSPAAAPSSAAAAGSGATSSSLSLKKWEQWIAFLVVAGGAFAGVWNWSYKQGEIAGKNEVGTQKAAVERELGSATAARDIANDTAKKLSDKAEGLQTKVSKLETEIAIRDENLKTLTNQFSQFSGCRYSQAQLSAIQERMRILNADKRCGGLFCDQPVDADKIKNLDFEINQLQQTSLALINQINACQK